MSGKKPTDLPPSLSRRIQPEDLQALVRLLRRWWGWTRAQIAAASGVSAASIYHYEKGKSKPPWSRIEMLAAGADIPLHIVEHFLLPGIVAVREARGRPEGDAISRIFDRLTARLQSHCHFLASVPVERRKETEEIWPPAEMARKVARRLWQELQGCADEDRWHLVERWDEYRRPGLAELLCHESEDAASDRADRALALAKLACRVAELVPEEGTRKRRLVGYALLFLANAIRVSGELRAARATFEEGLAAWNAGEGEPIFLDQWRVLDLEASLLRDEREFTPALDRLNETLVLAPDEEGRIRLKRAAVLEHMNEGERAVEELRKAEPLIDREREPRLFFGARFNLATNLCLLDRFEEAEALFPEVRDLAATLQLELHNLRVKWLAGRIAAGRGRLAEADAALEEVRQEFTRLESAWDCSLVTLEQATVRLRQGHTAEVKLLADELVWVFNVQGIHREALAALTLFKEAAEKEQATADLTEKIVRYLRKAQGDPELRFSEE